MRFLFLSLLFLCSAHVSQAETLFYKPGITLEQEYTDNILFTRDDPESDLITTLSPEFSIENRSFRTRASLTARVDSVFYHEFDDLDSVDPTLLGKLDYRWNERLSVGGDATYLEDSRNDRDTEDTGLVLSGDRERMSGNLFGTYQLSEVMQATLSAGMVTEDISDPDSEANDTLNFRFSLTRNMSKWMANTLALFDISYMQYDSESKDVRDIDFTSLPDDIVVVIVNPDEGVPSALVQSYFATSTYDVWQTTVGFSRDVTERFSCFLKAGVSSVASNGSSRIAIGSEGETFYDDTLFFDDGTTWGWLLFGGVSYRGELDSIELNLSRDVQTAGGVNGTTERSMISTAYHRRLSETLSFRLSASAYLNQRDRAGRSDLDELTLNGVGTVSYAFWESWKAALGWRYTWIEERDTTYDSAKDKNYLFARVVKTFQL